MLLDQILTRYDIERIEGIPRGNKPRHLHEATLLTAYIQHVQRHYRVNAESPKITAYDMVAMHEVHRMPSLSQIVDFLYERGVERYRITYRRFES